MTRTPILQTASPAGKTAEILDLSGPGTALANLNTIRSCNVDPPSCAQHGKWGGVRNHADRVSEYLTRRQIEEMLAAASYAQATDRPFSRFWTIHYERAGIPDRDGARFIRKVLKRLGEHVRRAGGDIAAIWARENGHGKGAHVHILLHTPPGYSFRNRTRGWIKGAGGTYRKGVSCMRVVGGTLASASIKGAHHEWNERNILAYLHKGCARDVGAAFGLQRCGDGGPIIGKRCGWTQNLGHAARARPRISSTVQAREPQ